MQKKLIALAVAGLVSAPAFAQSNVTIYGIVDMGYQYTSGSDTHKSRTGLDSGMQSGSRIGFRGTEDLGNGLKASFVLEESIGVDVGSGGNYSRQAFLALSGNFGTVAAGRQYTPQFNLVGAVDPFGVGTIGDAFAGRGVWSAGTVNGGQTIRLDNLLAYVSPNMGGFTVTAGYTADADGNEASAVKGGKSGNLKVWAISPVYNNGPLMVGLNYHRVKVDAVGGATHRVADLGATYDFGVVKLAAMYGANKVKTPGNSDSEKQWLVGATVPVSEAGKVLVSYARNKFDTTGSDQKTSKWAVGYTHDLSKRTNLYAVYARMSQNSAAEAAQKFAVYNDIGAGKANYQRGMNVGIRHRF